MKRILLIIGILLIILCSIAGNRSRKKAPEFSLRSIDGKNIKLSDYKGKILILNFFATWCPPCKKEIPDFVKFYRQYKNKGVEIVGVAVGSKEKNVKELVKKFNINYPVVMSDGRIEKLFGGIRFVPTTFIIDGKGNIIRKRIGMIGEEELKKIVDECRKK